MWHPATAGAALMLVWAVGQAWALAGSAPAGATGVLSQALYILGFTAAAGAAVGGLYWALGLEPLRSSLPLRWLAGAAAAMAYLIILTLAASQKAVGGPWARVARPTFLLSTLLLSLIIGWLIARDPFGLASSSERVYLTPGEYAALSAAEQERLSLDSTQVPGPSGPGSGG